MRNAILALALIVPAAAYAASFDGEWQYRLEHNSSSPKCRGFGGGTLEIRDGQFSGWVHHRLAGKFVLSGEVGEDGTAAFEARGYDTVLFKGRIDSDHGNGTWRSSRDSNCTGTWELTRS